MRKTVLPYLALGVVISINIWLRAFPIFFPQLLSEARDIVEREILCQAVSGYHKQNKQEIKKRVLAEYARLKDNYQDSSGQTYLMELDCWNWARFSENVLRRARPGDVTVNSREQDSLSLAPPWPDQLSSGFLFYLSAFLYKIFSLFRPVPFYAFLFYLPLFFTTIFITALFIFCMRRAGLYAAVTSCLYVGLAQIFLERSCAGWFDTDVLNMLFPLLIVWSYLKIFDVSTLRLRALWLFICGLCVGLFCFTWPGWWFIFLIIIIYELYSLVELGLRRVSVRNARLGALFKQHMVSLSLFSAFSLLWVLLLCGPDPLEALYSQFQLVLNINHPFNYSIWPNVLSTVSELKKADLAQMSTLAGQVILFIPALVCLLVLYSRTLRRRVYNNPAQESAIIFAVWAAVILFASSRGVRFVMFLLLPLGISLGFLIDEALRFFLSKGKKLAAAAVLVIAVFLNGQAIYGGYLKAGALFPIMNDNWYDVLRAIEKLTPKEAIINSWWDFGDWFKAVSRRRVIFDGQSQDTPQAYWMAKVLMSADEEKAIAILRMLNNGGNKAFELLNKNIKDPIKAVLLLEKVLSLDPQASRRELAGFLPAEDVEGMLKLLYAKPAPAYFVLDSSMRHKIGSISYLGNWNFLKAGAWRKNSRQQNGDVSRRFRFYGEISRGRRQGALLLFDNGLVRSLKEQTVYLYSHKESKYKIPKSLFIIDGDKLKEISYPHSSLEFSALIFKSGEKYQSLLLSRELAQSLYSRLYFLNGLGLRHFRPVIDQKCLEGNIKVFEILWE